MVVKLKTHCSETLAFVTESKSGKCISGDFDWFPLESMTDDLTYYDTVVMEVYDLARSNRWAYQLSTENRKCLWKRDEVKELTVAEIEKLLGYPIKIVKES